VSAVWVSTDLEQCNDIKRKDELPMPGKGTPMRNPMRSLQLQLLRFLPVVVRVTFRLISVYETKTKW
jgi:hypothetical protein